MSAELLEQGPLLRSVRFPKKRREEALHEHWKLLHAAGHLALLGTMPGEGDVLEVITGDNLALRSAFSFALTSSTALRFIVQGAWAAGRPGKRLLPAYKRALAQDVAFFDWLDTVFSLVAIGRRRSGLRAEVSKALLAAPEMVPQSNGAARLREEMRDTLAAVSVKARARFATSWLAQRRVRVDAVFAAPRLRRLGVGISLMLEWHALDGEIATQRGS
jgi:hypothetical protein